MFSTGGCRGVRGQSGPRPRSYVLSIFDGWRPGDRTSELRIESTASKGSVGANIEDFRRTSGIATRIFGGRNMFVLTLTLQI